ncbi:MAG: Mrp family chromosome partitioning ATPase [Sulfitobacter sp.]|jgi:protein-tyrosine kinase
MKDTYFSDDMTGNQLDAAIAISAAGLGHSIRPRRDLGEQAKRRLLDDAYAAPVSQADRPHMPPATTAVPARKTTPERAVAPTGWDDLPMARDDLRQALTSTDAAVGAEGHEASERAFDLLRTRLRQTTQENGWVHIGITAPTSGCGTTYTAAHLAKSLSRVAGSRSVLMDFNLRNPGIAKAFGLAPTGTMEAYLDGGMADQDHLLRINDTLALGVNSTVSRSAAEVLQAPKTQSTLARMTGSLRPDLVIYDLPPMLECDDVSAFMPQLDAVLVVSDGTQTLSRELLECERMLDSQVPLLGVVLNNARASSIRRFR